jgi:hypothetical protein
MADLGGVWMTRSSPSTEFAAHQTPAGEECANNMVADCAGRTTLDAATLAGRSTNGYCDDGRYDAFLVCSAFKFDSGLCGGVPATWACPAGYYNTRDGCDCDCGAWDPDCSDSSQYLYGCPYSATACQNTKVSPGVYAPQCVNSIVR